MWMNSHGVFLRGQDVPSDDFSGDELEVWKSSENLKIFPKKMVRLMVMNPMVESEKKTGFSGDLPW